MKLYDFDTMFENYKDCFIEVDHYSHNHALAIQLSNKKYGPITTLTVCIDHPRKLEPNESFVDTNNNPEAEEFIKSNGLGEPTGEVGFSGWCVYPLYKFNLDKLNQ